MNIGGFASLHLRRIAPAAALLAAAAAAASLQYWAVFRDPSRTNEPSELDPIEEIDPAAIYSLETNPLFIDARTPAEFQTGHILGAIPLPASGIWDDESVGKVHAGSAGGKLIVVYCGGGLCRASHEIARRLRGELGIRRVVVLRGGWEAWKAAGGDAR